MGFAKDLGSRKQPIAMIRYTSDTSQEPERLWSIYSLLLVLVGMALGMPELFSNVSDSPFLVPARILSVLLVLQLLVSGAAKSLYRFPTEVLLIWLVFTVGVLTTIVVFVADGGVLRIFLLIASQQFFNVVVLSFVAHAFLTVGGIKSFMLGVLLGGILQMALYFFYNDLSQFNSVSGRYKAFFVNPNSLAAYLVLVYISVLYFSLLLGTLRGLFLIAILFVPLFLVMDATASRLGLLMLLSISLIFLLKVWPKLFIVAGLVITSMLVMSGKGQEYVDRLVEQSESIQRYEKKINSIDSISRLDLWRGGVQGIRETFPLGAGIGQSQDIQNFYRWMSGVNISLADQRLVRGEGLSMHNTYITLLLEYGLVSFLIYMFLLIKFLFEAMRRLLLARVTANQILMVLLVFNIAVASLAQNGFLSLLFWFSMAMVIALSYEKVGAKKPVPVPGQPVDNPKVAGASS